MDKLIKKYENFFFPNYKWYKEVILDQGKIVFTKQAVKESNSEERNRFIKTIRPEVIDFFKRHKYKVQVSVLSKHKGEYPYFSYEFRPESDFLFNKMKEDAGTIHFASWFWPNGQAGQFWTEKVPDPDSI